MLRPQISSYRDARRLDGLWNFVPDVDGVGHSERWWSAPLVDPVAMPVPASFNDVLVDRGLRDHVGDVWYQQSVTVPFGWSDQRVLLRFDAATHQAIVWVGDALVVEHEGGYLPFEVDITSHVTPGASVRITVCVNNELSWETIPPGSVEQTRAGGKKIRYFHDFFNYAGLHRSVWLHTRPQIHVEDVRITTDIDGADGLVRCRASAGGADAVVAELRSPTGELVATASGFDVELRVPEALLWAPGRGNLYELTTKALRGADVVDEYRMPVGIRTVEVRGTEFLINGAPFYFRGFGMHEDHLVLGKGHDDAAMAHDFALLGWIGANSLRTSHYPYAEEILDHADRLGIVVIDETAAVGLNVGVGGGIMGGHIAPTFGEGPIGVAAQTALVQHVRDLIDRDRNHPSVVMWSVANEPESSTPESREFFEPVFAAARNADDTRPVGFVNVMLAPPDRCLLSDLADVVMINRYFGWYVDHGALDAAAAALEAELRLWASRQSKPILVTEYGADTVAGLHSVDGSPWTEEFQVQILDRYHAVFDRIDAVVGEQVWNFADFATSASIVRVDGNKKGVFTRDRRPKMAAHRLRERWTAAS